MSYIVTLQRQKTNPKKLKAVAIGSAGVLNCHFPDEYQGISRFDLNNEGVQFEVIDLPLSTRGNFYYLTDKYIKRIVPPSERVPLNVLLRRWYQSQDVKQANTLQSPQSSAASEQSQPGSTSQAKMSTTSTSSSDQAASSTSFVLTSDKIGSAPIELEEALFEGEFYSIDDFDDVDRMSAKPFFKNGKMTTWAAILVKLYEACVNPGNDYSIIADVRDANGNIIGQEKGISRKKLQQLTGAAGGHGDGERSGFFNSYNRLGLAYINPRNLTTEENMIFPGPNLEAFMQGKITSTMGLQDLELNSKTKKYEWEPYIQTQNLMGTVGTIDMPKKTHCSSKTKRPDLMEDPHAFDLFPGIHLVEPKKEQTQEQPINREPSEVAKNMNNTNPINLTPVEPESAPSFNLYDQLNSDEIALEENLNESDTYCMEYRNFCGVDPTCPIQDCFSEYKLRDMCCCNGWAYDYVKNKLLGEL